MKRKVSKISSVLKISDVHDNIDELKNKIIADFLHEMEYSFHGMKLIEENKYHIIAELPDGAKYSVFQNIDLISPDKQIGKYRKIEEQHSLFGRNQRIKLYKWE